MAKVVGMNSVLYAFAALLDLAESCDLDKRNVVQLMQERVKNLPTTDKNNWAASFRFKFVSRLTETAYQQYEGGKT